MSRFYTQQGQWRNKNVHIRPLNTLDGACNSSSLLSLYICVGLFFLMLMMYGGYVPKLFLEVVLKMYIFFMCARKRKRGLELFAAA